MNINIHNKYLSISVAKKGAELKSVKEYSTGVEYIWQSDPQWWTGSAPILFPIVGRLKNNQYSFNGRTYSMPQHGIVRKKDWTHIDNNKQSITFQTQSDEVTKESYPFDYTLTVCYTLVEKSVIIQYDVLNTGDSKMYFSIGSHPAFNIPFAGGKWTDYYYRFSNEESTERYLLNDGLLLETTEKVFDNERDIFLTETIFEKDAIVLKFPNSRTISLKKNHNSKSIALTTDGTPYIGLWAPPHAPFACIEPWHGIADHVNSNGNIKEKEGILSIEQGETYKTSYSISIS